MSALHRERIRTTAAGGAADLPPPPRASAAPPAAKRQRSLDLDYEAMEFKSLLPSAAGPSAFVVQTSIVDSQDEGSGSEGDPYEDCCAASLSDSLVERFDAMEPGDGGPERRIATVAVRKGVAGRLGLKITGTPAGIFVDAVDATARVMEGQLRPGDRLVAVDGRSLENVPYGGALDLIRRAGDVVNFLVSQVKN